jgi:hypothetical protein
MSCFRTKQKRPILIKVLFPLLQPLLYSVAEITTKFLQAVSNKMNFQVWRTAQSCTPTELCIVIQPVTINPVLQDQMFRL